jgi:hypothetical protein
MGTTAVDQLIGPFFNYSLLIKSVPLNTAQLAVAYILRSWVPKVTTVSPTFPLTQIEFIIHPPTTIFDPVARDFVTHVRVLLPRCALLWPSGGANERGLQGRLWHGLARAFQ